MPSKKTTDEKFRRIETLISSFIILFDRKDYYNKSLERELVEITVVEHANIVT